MSPPKKVSISGNPVSIHFVDKLTYGKAIIDAENPDIKLYGCMNHAQGKIYLEKDMTEHMQKVTLVHEALHAMLFQTTFHNHDHEEEIVLALDHMVYRFIRDNPILVKYLQEK